MFAWKAVKWVAYRLPILATAVFVVFFVTKDQLSQSQSPALRLMINTLTAHLALVLVSLLIFFFLCAALWGLADYFDRPELWRTRK